MLGICVAPLQFCILNFSVQGTACPSLRLGLSAPCGMLCESSLMRFSRGSFGAHKKKVCEPKIGLQFRASCKFQFSQEEKFSDVGGGVELAGAGQCLRYPPPPRPRYFLTAGDKLYMWGQNDQGQLGDGTTLTRLVPTEITGVAYARAISLGGDHSAASSGM